MAKILDIPKQTQLEIDALTPVAGETVYNSDTDKINFSNSSAWNPVASFSDVTLQNGYDNASNITLTASNPLQVTGIDNTDPAQWKFRTPVQLGVIAQFDFHADNSLAADVRYAKIVIESADNDSGFYDGKISFNIAESGVDTNYMNFNGNQNRINILRNISALGQEISCGGVQLTGDADFTTPISGLGVNYGQINNLVSNEAIVAGSLCKASATAFRVESVKPADSGSTGIICSAFDTTAAPGDPQKVKGLNAFSCLADSAVVAGDNLKRSLITAGQVSVAAPGDDGVFAVALEPKGASLPFLAARTLNVPQQNPLLCAGFTATPSTGNPSYIGPIAIVYSAKAEGTWTKVTGMSGMEIRGDIGFASDTATVNVAGFYQVGISAVSQVTAAAERISQFTIQLDGDDSDKVLATLQPLAATTETSSSQYQSSAGTVMLLLPAGTTIKVFYSQLNAAGGGTDDLNIAIIHWNILKV